MLNQLTIHQEREIRSKAAELTSHIAEPEKRARMFGNLVKFLGTMETIPQPEEQESQ